MGHLPLAGTPGLLVITWGPLKPQEGPVPKSALSLSVRCLPSLLEAPRPESNRATPALRPLLASPGTACRRRGVWRASQVGTEPGSLTLAGAGVGTVQHSGVSPQALPSPRAPLPCGPGRTSHLQTSRRPPVRPLGVVLFRRSFVPNEEREQNPGLFLPLWGSPCPRGHQPGTRQLGCQRWSPPVGPQPEDGHIELVWSVSTWTVLVSSEECDVGSHLGRPAT